LPEGNRLKAYDKIYYSLILCFFTLSGVITSLFTDILIIGHQILRVHPTPNYPIPRTQTQSCHMARTCCFLRSNLQICWGAYYHLGSSAGHGDPNNSLRCWIGCRCCFAPLSFFQNHLCLNRCNCYPCKYADRDRRPCTSLDDQRQSSHLFVVPSLLLCNLVLVCRCIYSSSCIITTGEHNLISCNIQDSLSEHGIEYAFFQIGNKKLTLGVFLC
jgi:hypothetical protein